MSELSEPSDRENYGERDEDFNIEDYQDDIESDESFNDALDQENNEEDNGVNTQTVSDYIGPRLADGHRFDKKFVCIKYPANVVNSGKAIETLGGLADISRTVDTKNRRMELRFRPDDGYCKPACGDRYETCGVLLRIRVKKSRREKVEKDAQAENSPQNEDAHSTNDASLIGEKYDINTVEDTTAHTTIDSQTSSSENKKSDEKNIPPSFYSVKYENLSEDTNYKLPKVKVLGRVDTEFRFTSLCDFQYLPITKNKEDPTKDECIYESLFPIGLPSYFWMREEVPYFLPPAAFSRMDNVQHYIPKTETSKTIDQFVIGKTRKRRAGLANFISFNHPNVPLNPPKGIETAMKVKFLQTTHLERMRQLFQERPVWSKTALMYVTKFSNEHLKVLLPAVAYYFTTGPWRITWSRLGYDPRKNPEARMYQILDYRLKAMHGLQSNVTCKRNYAEYSLPQRLASAKAKQIVLSSNAEQPPTEKKQKNVMEDNVFIYRPGTIPPSRQMFYQYCDLYVPEIQEMFDKYIVPLGTVCHEKLGWLPVGFDDMCREIINKQVRSELRKLMNIPENHPTSLPRKRNAQPKLITKKKYRNREAEKEKRRKMKEEQKQQQQQQPAAMSIIDDEDLMQSDEEEWNNVSGDEINELDIEDEMEMENEDDDYGGDAVDGDHDSVP